MNIINVVFLISLDFCELASRCAELFICDPDAFDSELVLVLVLSDWIVDNCKVHEDD